MGGWRALLDVTESDRRRRLERLFTAHAASVRAYARRRAGATVADDITSEVFVVAWRRLDDVPADALPWLLGCARRILSHHYRRSRRDAALVDRLEVVARARPSGDPGLAQALAELGKSDRELLLLIAWEGLDVGQAAEVLGCSRNAAAVRLHRARKRLARVLYRADELDRRPQARTAAKESL